MLKKIPIAVLISGRGSNMISLIEACQATDFPAYIEVVLTNNPMAPGIKKAESYGIKTIIIDHKKYPTRQEFDQEMDKALRSTNTEIICLAGFMRILTNWFTTKWAGKILNIHPSLLPDFKGAHAHRDVLAAKAKESGCTAHMVTAEMDSGEILGQAKVPVFQDDSEETLAARVLEQEHLLYPKVLKEFIFHRHNKNHQS